MSNTKRLVANQIAQALFLCFDMSHNIDFLFVLMYNSFINPNLGIIVWLSRRAQIMGTLTPSEVTFFFEHGTKWGGRVIDRRFVPEDDTIVAATIFVVENRAGISSVVLEGDINLRSRNTKIEIIQFPGRDWDTDVPVIVMNHQGEFVFERDSQEIRPFSYTTYGNLLDPYDPHIDEHDGASWFRMSAPAREKFARGQGIYYEAYKSNGFELGAWVPSMINGGYSYWEAIAQQDDK